MDNFQEFVRGYLTAALWSSNDNADESGGEPLDKNYSEADIAPSSRAAMERDCQRFFDENRTDLLLYVFHVRYNRAEGTPWDYAGHDFWLTANGHGSGFWDRDGVGESGRGDAPEGLGERLSEAARAFASDLIVGDDGKIYVTPER